MMMGRVSFCEILLENLRLEPPVSSAVGSGDGFPVQLGNGRGYEGASVTSLSFSIYKSS